MRRGPALVATAGGAVAAVTGGAWGVHAVFADAYYHRLVPLRDAYGNHCTSKQLVTHETPNYKYDFFHWVRPRHGPGEGGSRWRVVAFEYSWVDSNGIVRPIRTETGGPYNEARGYGPSGKRITASDTYQLRFRSITRWEFAQGGTALYEAVSRFGWGGWTDNGSNWNNVYCTQ
jgi:hypothetical protein